MFPAEKKTNFTSNKRREAALFALPGFILGGLIRRSKKRTILTRHNHT